MEQRAEEKEEMEARVEEVVIVGKRFSKKSVGNLEATSVRTRFAYSRSDPFNESKPTINVAKNVDLSSKNVAIIIP